MPDPAAPDWWISFYDDSFADVVMDTGEDETARRTAELLAQRLALPPGAAVLDQGCGQGRLSLPLARRGFRVVGVDLSPEYVRRAAERAESADLPCKFYAADAFDFVPDEACDGAFNWWSSFGYAEEDERNLQMLRRAWEALRPGGRFALDYYGAPHLLRTFSAELRLQYRTRSGSAEVLRTGRLEFATGMLEQEWRFADRKGAEQRRCSRTRLYMPHELCALARRAGFVDPEVYSDLEQAPFTLASPRCVLLARKPE